MMKILMIVRPTLYSSPGGDTTQIEMTAKYLRGLGVNVDVIKSDSVSSYNQYDLIHFFNIIRPDDILPHIKNKIPFVVSTIFVDYSAFEKRTGKGFKGLLFKLATPGQIEYLKVIARWIRNGDKIKSKFYLFNGHDKSVRKIISEAAMLLPNSYSEFNRLVKEYKVSAPFYKIVNAVDHAIFNDNVKPDVSFKDHVLCIGRIEARKNQLNLIKAMLDTGINLSIIGKSSPNHIDYFNECKRLVAQSETIQIIEQVAHDDLPAIYKAAKVHVLPSWFETTGLSSLEAGTMGCNIVVTKMGDTEEYFQDMAYYCDPGSIESIRREILSAYASEVNPRLKKDIVEKYTWGNTAKQTMEAYLEVLKSKNLK